jgi:hypothetical protein
MFGTVWVVCHWVLEWPPCHGGTVEILIVHSVIHGQNIMHYRKYARPEFSQGLGIPVIINFYNDDVNAPTSCHPSSHWVLFCGSNDWLPLSGTMHVVQLEVFASAAAPRQSVSQLRCLHLHSSSTCSAPCAQA